VELEQIRREYLQGGLRRNNLQDDPIDQFQTWLSQAVSAGVSDPTAMVLATVDPEGQPSQRIVLLKHLDQNGLIFYTNYNSAKARDLEKNARVCVHFPWHVMERQVRVDGRAEKISVAESLKYFLTRPKDSQIAAWASPQSQIIDSKKMLLMQFESMKAKFSNGDVPLPDAWGGYRIKPHRFEFWQGGASRLHDRFEYALSDSKNWNIERLSLFR